MVALPGNPGFGPANNAGRISVRHKGGGPVFHALPFASGFAAVIAAHSVVAALIARRRDGLGQGRHTGAPQRFQNLPRAARKW